MLRRAGIPVDSHRILSAQQALAHVDIGNRLQVQAALECTLVSRQQDLEVFRQLFDAFFKDPDLAQRLLTQLLPKTKSANQQVKRSPRAQEALRPIIRNQPEPSHKEDEIRMDAAMSASDRHRLLHADFEGLNASEFLLIEQLVREIPLQIPTIASRRYRPSNLKGSQLHWGKIMRNMARHSGEMVEIDWKSPSQQPLPLLILVDTSGSMQRYARLMLSFLHQATKTCRRQVFAFGTQLTDLNAAFKLHDTDSVLADINRQIPDFGGGTKISESLLTLRTKHRHAIVANRSVVLLITDGLDTGQPNDLERELGWLKRQARHLLWLNPLLRYDGYQPLASGARILSRHVDHMLAIHNLSHLQELARSLARLLYQVR